MFINFGARVTKRDSKGVVAVLIGDFISYFMPFPWHFGSNEYIGNRSQYSLLSEGFEIVS